MSKLWSAIQSHYRPSSAYQVSVVLIEGTRPAVSPLPVLSRGKRDPVTQRDRGVVVNPDLLPPLPTLVHGRAADASRPAPGSARPSPSSGMRLAGTGHERAADAPPARRARRDRRRRRRRRRHDGDVHAAQRRSRAERVAPGQLSASVRFTPTGETRSARDQRHPALIAPDPVIVADAALGLPAATVMRGGCRRCVTVTLASRPQVRLEQSAILLLDAVEADARAARTCRGSAGLRVSRTACRAGPTGCACASTAPTACCSIAPVRRRCSTPRQQITVPA